MINIITQIFKIPDWLNIQYLHLNKYTASPYMIYMGYTDFIPQPPADQYKLINLNSVLPNVHYIHANYMCNEVVLPSIQNDDVVVFLDIDAFPCDDWDSKVMAYLQKHDIVAMYRYEDLGYCQEPQHYPCSHLAFFATTKQVWKKHNLRWHIDGGLQNPQFGMEDIIKSNNIKVKKLERTNIFNAHKIMFGVYDDIIYHHCCGVRGITKNNAYEGGDAKYRDKILRGNLNNLEQKLQDIIEVNTKIFHIIFEAIKKDQQCNFIKRYFLGKP